MSFIEMPLEDARESEIVPEGFYELQVVSVKPTKNEASGRVGVMMGLKVMNPPSEVENPALISHWIGGTLPDDTKETKNMILLNTRRFLETFNVPHEGNGFSPEDLAGATGECLVVVRKDDRDGHEDEEVNKLQLPKLEK